MRMLRKEVRRIPRHHNLTASRDNGIGRERETDAVLNLPAS